jgi:hypothetical protein
MATTPSSAILYGLDYRDTQGALSHIKPADIEAFQGGKSFVIEYLGGALGQGNAALTAANASALETQGIYLVSVFEESASWATWDVGYRPKR